MFTVDGISYNMPCTIERTAEIRSSDISGMLMDKSYFNDVLGTYMQYDVSIAVPINEINSYTTLYEILTQPVDAHSFVLPYNQSTLEITGMIEAVTDSMIRLSDTKTYWRGTHFTVTSIYPTKTLTLGEAIVRGMSSPPNIKNAEIGETYIYTASGWVPGWVPITYADADNNYY